MLYFFLNISLTSENFLLNKTRINFKALFNKAGINFKAAPEMHHIALTQQPYSTGDGSSTKSSSVPQQEQAASPKLGVSVKLLLGH